MQNEQKKTGFLQDSMGNKSSKRTALFLSLGIVAAVVLEVLICSPLHMELANQSLLEKIIEFGFIGAGAITGACASEYFAKK